MKSSTLIAFLAEERDHTLDAFEIGADGYLPEPLEKEKLEQVFLNLEKQRDIKGMRKLDKDRTATCDLSNTERE